MKNNMTWPTKKLGEAINFLKGKKMPVTEEQRLGYKPYIGIDTLRTREYKLFTPEKNGIKCSKDDVLVVWDGAYAGTVGIEVSGFAGSTVAKVVIRESELDSRFLRYFWELNGTKIRNAAQGAAIPHLSKPFINNLKIPLPPLAIQKQIVERLDKIAEAQKLNDGLIQKTDELFQSLLHKELNPHTKKFGVGVNPVGPADAKAMAGKKDWEAKELGEVALLVRGPFGGSLRRDIFVESGDCVYEQGNVIDGDLENFRYFVTPEKFRQMKRFEVLAGDILMSCSGTIGKFVIIPRNFRKGIINQALLKITPNQKVIGEFLKLTLENYFLLNKSHVKGIAIKNIAAVKELKKVKISLPRLETQKQIVAKLSAVQDYKKQLIEQKTKLKELFDSSLAKSMKQ